MILTVLEVEYRAVRSHLLQLKEEQDEFRTVYERGLFKSPTGEWEILLAQLDRYNAPAAVTTGHAIRFADKPEVALLVGVAGGLKDVRLGDVVAADTVYDCEAGKSTQRFEPRLKSKDGSPMLVQRAKQMGRSQEWPDQALNLPSAEAPKLFVEPIASGEKVIASHQSEEYARLRSLYGDALAVETEGFGFLTAARHHPGLDAMVIRGISDLIEGKAAVEAGGSQERASRNAAAFAFALLSRLQRPSTGLRHEDDEVDTRVRDALQDKTRQLLNWPQRLPGNQWLERPELQSLLQRIEQEPTSRTVLLGRPGSGKSALLAHLGELLHERDDLIMLALKADRLPTSVGTQQALQEWLGLPAPLSEVLENLSLSRTVVLLVDQLDALSEFVDLHTERLNVLMDLLERLGEIPNLHIVASCRTFEFRHDSRMSRYQADVIEFQLPKWSVVETVLRDSGLEPSGWSEKAREVLRTPQHLKLFLQHLDGAGKPFESYQAMLEQLWQQHESDPRKPELSSLLSEAAAEMTNREELSLPVVWFKERYKGIRQLLADADGILQQDGMRIGFTHQTLLEFTRARTFVSGHERLDAFVLPRQETLSIRPKLWSILEYLRATDDRTYRMEFERLWRAPTLRPHVRALIIDFLGQLEAPTDVEMGWLRDTLKDRTGRIPALQAMAGSPGWFEKLARLYLPSFMSEPEQHARAVLPVLFLGWRINREWVLELVENHWLAHEEKNELAVLAFQYLAQWDERSVQAVESILRRSPIRTNVANDLASVVSAHAPELAPRVVRAAVERQSQDLLSGKREEGETKRACERLLTSPHELYSAPEIAEAAPFEYLRALWPWFVKLLMHFERDTHSFVTGYARSGLSLLIPGFEEDRDSERTLLGSIHEALIGAAKESPSEFLEFVEQWSHCELLEVHRLLAQGLCHTAKTHSKKEFEYLLADPRRLVLGGYPDAHGESCALIQALAPWLESADLLRLEETIKNWKYYSGDVPPADPRDPLWRVKNEREHRLRLLWAIPEEKRSSTTRRLVQEERLALGEPEEYAARAFGLSPIESPMSSEQMGKAHGEDIVRLFDELTDDTEWDHPRRKREHFGGSIEVARAFATFAVKHPKRAIAIMRRFEPGKQERPVAYALSKLSQSKHDPAELSRWVVEFDKRGFGTEKFRHAAAGVLEYVAYESNGLEDSLQELLSSWLKDAEIESSPDEVETRSQNPDSRPHPILRGFPIGETLPGGNYPILSALLDGYRLREPAAIEQAFSVLEAHLGREERPRVWQSLCYNLIWLLWRVERTRASFFLNTLLARYPSVLASRSGVYLLDAVRWWSPPELLRTWVGVLQTVEWSSSAQAFGELVARIAIQNGHPWAKDAVEAILAGKDFRESKRPSSRLGLAFAGSQLWSEPALRNNVAELLVRLIPGADGPTAMAIMDTFNGENALLDEPETLRLLQSVLEYPEILRGGSHSLFEQLGVLVSLEPELIVRLCHAMLDQLPRHPQMVVPGDELVNLALTLERQERIRPQGLLLFERMLQESIVSSNAKQALWESDGRRGRAGYPSFNRRSRRARRRRRGIETLTQ